MATQTAEKVALVLGVTGGYGHAMAAELLRRGWTVRALVRDPARAGAAAEALRRASGTTDAPGRLILLPGDLLDVAALGAAARGCSVLVHGANSPYTEWERSLLPMARNVAAVAAAEGLTILFPGNVYALAAGLDLDESAAEAPPTRKGELRAQAEAILREATGGGARLIIVRAGDFFGLGHGSAWMSQLLAKAARGGAIVSPGRGDVLHSWAYLPDLAWAHVALAELPPSALPPAATLHFRGHVLSGDRLITAAREALGDPRRGVSALPWWLLRLASPLWPMGRELVAMRYLWEQPLTLDDSRLRALLPSLATTPLEEAMRVELAALGRRPA